MTLHAMGNRSQFDEYQSKHGENESLNNGNEKLQTVEGNRHEVGREHKDNSEKNLAGKDVAEKPEGERDNFSEFRD